LETTALGAAWLAGQRAGVLPGKSEFAANWALDRTFKPNMNAETRAKKYGNWQRAIRATLSYQKTHV
ncbi:MAG: glycerol kinase, partial [Ruegeria sp.]